MKLAGKKALVTGGSRGIGAAIALRLAQDGADVALTYNASEGPAKEVVAQIEKLERKAFIFKADAGVPETLAGPVGDAIKALGGLDILINNAGIGTGGTIEDTSLENFDRILNVNVRGVFETTRLCVPHMKAGGRIILVGSILGERAIFPGIGEYNASKFAVAGMGRSWAHDLGPKGITVNVIQPGPIDTDMNPDNGGADSQAMISMTALKRYGTAEEIAAVAAFLASEDSSYVTGACINVDGGSNA